MLPKVILYNGISLDGRIEGFDVDMGKYYELVSHWQENATFVGSGTILKAPFDDRKEEKSAFSPIDVDAEDPRPILVIVDSKGRVRNWHVLKESPYW
jgi:2,5-diamino-6-(ribosylamino)-4(3H)-pyrimidinone 5'-phosphate reductase